MRSLHFFLAVLGVFGTTSADPKARQQQACNNSPSLCSRPYSSLTHLGAHDSPFVRDASTGDSTSGNQFYNSTVQLSAGVRLLTAQVFFSNGDYHLCHSSCDLLDAGLLSTWLAEIKEWMDQNADEVVTVLLVNQANASPSDLAVRYSQSNITEYVYTPASISAAPASWPTLQELISANTRLLNFVASLNTTDITSNSSYLMDEFTFIFENPFNVTSSSGFSCQPQRPSSVENDIQGALSSNKMPFMNHFLDQNEAFGIQIPDVDNINSTNSPSTSVAGSLGQAAQSCQQAYGRAPTFLLVDFFDRGPALTTVDNLNGVTDTVGRISPPSQSAVDASEGGRRETSFEGVIQLDNMVKMGQTPKKGAWIWGAGDWSWGGLNTNGGNLLS